MSLNALIIEDDPTLAMIFSGALKAAGYVPEVINDGAQAEIHLLHVKPDLIMLDLHLPKISGEEILKGIREDDRFDDTRVIIASADPAFARRLRDQVDFVLEKPVSFHQLRLLASRLAPVTAGG